MFTAEDLEGQVSYDSCTESVDTGSIIISWDTFWFEHDKTTRIVSIRWATILQDRVKREILAALQVKESTQVLFSN